MAGQSRTLKLSILGDVDQLKKSLNTGATDVDGFADKLGGFAKKAGAAFLVAGAAAAAYAGKLAVDGVKAAIEDEKAQTQLALALENATGATNEQIKATEASILKMSLASGVADDNLRPALQRLVLSTGDITKAQDLLSTALDISTATGKPLEAVANSLGKAYDGNTAALGKLGIGLSAAELKTMSFEEVQGRLTDLFGGAAAANAETYAGKIARVQVAFDEAKETVGTALLPILDKLLGFINQNALPAINAFSNAFSLTSGNGFGKVITDVGSVIKNTFTPIIQGVKSVFDNVKNAVLESKDEFESFYQVVKFIAPLIGQTIGAALNVIGPIAKVLITVFAQVLSAIKPLINTAVDGINLVIRGLNIIKPGSDIKYLSKIGDIGTTAGFSGTTPGGQSFSGTLPSENVTGSNVVDTTADPFNVLKYSTDPVARAKASAAINSMFNTGGINDAANQARTMSNLSNAGAAFTSTSAFDNNGTTINLTVNGAIDSEGTARTIIDTLNNSFYRGTNGATNLVTA